MDKKDTNVNSSVTDNKRNKVILTFMTKKAEGIKDEKILNSGKSEEKSLEERKGEAELKSIESDITLKIEIKDFIKCIVRVIMITCGLLIIFDICYFTQEGKHIYSEWFLAVIFSSQLVVLPLSLLSIVTKHLFPTDKNK